MLLSQIKGLLKLQMPNGKVADVLPEVLETINKYVQFNENMDENGGYIVGYQNYVTGNITLEKVSSSFPEDVRSRMGLILKSKRHLEFLKSELCRHSYYIGVWHTHPEKIPIPSSLDWYDWKQTLKEDKAGADYMFFLISGTEEIRFWAGNVDTGQITELFELKRR